MKPLEDGLEGIIESGRMPETNTPVGAFLNGNPAARQEVAEMMEISHLIRENFRVNEAEAAELEPAAGFYARVMARIEAQAVPPSIWNFFLEPLGMRLVYASLALAVLLFGAAMMQPGMEEEQVVAAEVAPVIEAEPAPVVRGAFLASDGDRNPVVESANPNTDRGAALMQLTVVEQ